MVLEKVIEQKLTRKNHRSNTKKQKKNYWLGEVLFNVSKLIGSIWHKNQILQIEIKKYENVIMRLIKSYLTNKWNWDWGASKIDLKIDAV